MNEMIEIDIMDYFHKMYNLKNELESSTMKIEDKDLYEKLIIELYQYTLYFHYLLEEEKYENYLEGKIYNNYQNTRQFLLDNESIPEPFILILKKLGLIEKEVLEILGISKVEIMEQMKKNGAPNLKKQELEQLFETTLEYHPYNNPLFYREHMDLAISVGKVLRGKRVSVAKIQALVNLTVPEIMTLPKHTYKRNDSKQVGGVK